MSYSFLVLILKVSKLEFIHQFRPIGLCNVNYKILMKILVNCLKNFMLDLITKYQSSFIPDRQIVDNIVVA